MNIFAEHDLRLIIKSLVSEAKREGKAITFEKLAILAGVQKAHVTNALSGRAVFQADQLFQVCVGLGLDKSERKYLMLLLEHEKSTVQARKKGLKRQIENLRNRNLQTESFLNLPVPEKSLAEVFPAYYLKPLHQVIHVAISIDQFARDASQLERILGISRNHLTEILRSLEENGIIRKSGGRWIENRSQTHLKRDSALYLAWRNQLQTMAQARSQNTNSGNSFGFTVVFSANVETFRIMQAKLLALVQELEPVVLNAEPKQVFHLSLDLFPWTET